MKVYKFDEVNIEFDRTDISFGSLTESYKKISEEIKDDFYESKFNDGELSTVAFVGKHVVGCIAISNIVSQNKNDILSCYIYGLGGVSDMVKQSLVNITILQLQVLNLQKGKRMKLDIDISQFFKYSHISANADNIAQFEFLSAMGFERNNNSSLFLFKLA
jgi:hypothetical protein